MRHFWQIMLHHFKKGKKQLKHKKMCAVYGEGAVTERTCQKWFAQFRAGDSSLDDALPGRPAGTDSNQIETLMENNPHYTTKEIADTLKLSKPIPLLVKNETCIFYFMEETKQTLWPTQECTEKQQDDGYSSLGELAITLAGRVSTVHTNWEWKGLPYTHTGYEADYQCTASLL